LDNELGFTRVSISFKDSKYEFTIVDSNGEHKILGGIGRRLKDKTELKGNVSITSSYGYWCDKNTFVMKMQLIETPFCYTISLCFEGNKLELKVHVNVSFGDKEFPIIKGES